MPATGSATVGTAPSAGISRLPTDQVSAATADLLRYLHEQAWPMPILLSKQKGMNEAIRRGLIVAVPNNHPNPGHARFAFKLTARGRDLVASWPQS